MKRILSIIITLFVCLVTVEAQNVDGAKVDNLHLKQDGNNMAVNMEMDFTSLDVASNRMVVFTPMLVNGNDSLELSSVGIYGRRRYYNHLRNDMELISGANGISYRASQTPDNISYNVVVPYQKWMNGAYLVMQRFEYGCCNKVLNEQYSQLGVFKEKCFAPQYLYLRPVPELEKTRSLSGSAYIDFLVNRIDIVPSFRNNQVELDKIIATIDSVRNDSDITLNAISIKGFASPEGAYEKNENLAKNRTEALKLYVQKLYDFAPDFIETSYEAEDWATLRAFVSASELPNKKQILSLIDGEREPDNKEWMIKTTYADDYKVMYEQCYPDLRRSDYKVEYTIRQYKNVDEIKKIFAESPQKLSLEEFYILAQQYDDNSRELNDVFETAVRMYPNDSVANLNAAISEMQNGDYRSAEPHLKKAGNSPEAIYARGIHAAFVKDYDRAIELLQQALGQGVEAAANAIEQINEIK